MAELPVNSTSGVTNNTWATTVNVVPAANAVTAMPTINPVQTSTVVSAASLAQSSISSTPINITQQTATPLSVASAVLPTSSTINATPTHPSSTTNSNVVPTAHPPLQGSPARATLRNTTGSDPTKVLDKHRLQELVKEVDPLEQMDDEVEELLVQLADDFIDNVVNASAQLAKHRKSSSIEVKDVQMHLERNWNMWIPGFGSSEEPRPYKKAATTEAHKQRMALIKKTLKKY